MGVLGPWLVLLLLEGRIRPIPSTQVLRPDLPGSGHRALSKQPVGWGEVLCLGPTRWLCVGSVTP